jgi:glycosyltransferase involved in cell wall biosynthesis
MFGSLEKFIRKHYFRPKVSIIIPVFNGSNYVRLAIDSALQQTYRNIEVIVVDDGSTDNTPQIVQSIRDRRLRYIKKANGGVASALNAGIAAMTSNYFCWLSHDDLFKKNKILKQVRTYKQYREQKKVILISDYNLIDSDGKLIAKVILDHALLSARPDYALFRGSIHGCSVFAPRRLFRKVGLFNEKLPYTQDYDLWLRALRHFRFVHMPQRLIRSRWHAEQSSKKVDFSDESTAFWIKALRTYPDSKKIELEGTVSKFYEGMANFLKTAKADGAATYANEMSLRYANPTAASQNLDHLKVSIIIPFFRGVPLLCAAVNSVLSQTHLNTEIVIVYDSPDDDPSGALPKELSPGREIRTYCQHRKGAGQARNYGIERATGDYIAFLDADDLFLPDKLSRQLQIMAQRQALISHTSYFAYGAEGRMKSDLVASGRFSGYVFPKILGYCPIAMPTVMVRSDVVTKLYKFPDMHHCEDALLWMEIAMDHEIVGIDEPLSVVRISPDSVAYDPAKQHAALLRIASYLERDPRFMQYTKQILRLRTSANYYAATLKSSAP